MATQMITLKLDSAFLKDIDNVVKTQNYHNRTEFIRNVLREGVENAKFEEFKAQTYALKGAAKRKTSEEEYEAIREKVAQEFGRKFKEAARASKKGQ